jgi:UV DNA damage endonuclease
VALGYACINMSLDSLNKNAKVTTNRSMIKKTFVSRGSQYASQLALANCQDLFKIVKWNEKMGIKFFRISSEMFPWASEYDIKTLPDYPEIRNTLEIVGKYAQSIGHRLTFHPGPFNKLPSDDPNVINNTSRDLEIHGEVFDLLCLPQTPFAKINIHVGAAYDDKGRACKNFIRNFKNLSQSVRSRLTVENDDKASLYSTRELYNMIYLEIGIPIVFDYHHHTFCTGDQTEQEALELAASTWNGIKPVVHYSESRSLEQKDPSIKPQAHSDYVYKYINTYGNDVDIMIEAKEKELALLKYYKIHQDKVTLA